MNEQSHYELIIIGGGAGAFAAAIKAENLSRKALMVSGGLLGGTCVNVGCVPSKRLLAAGEYYKQIRSNHFEGISTNSVNLDFKQVIESKRKLINKFQSTKYKDVSTSWKNVDLIEGTAKFTKDHVIEVNGVEYYGEKFVIATGSSPFIPNLEGLDKIDYLTNVEALELEELPKHLIILGGGAVALEFAQMYRNFGSEVTLINRSDRLLKEGEPEISFEIVNILKDEGMNMFLGTELKSVNKDENGNIVVSFNHENHDKTVFGDKLLVALGRTPNTASLNLESIGVELGGRGSIKVNNLMQSNVDYVYAAGDILGEPMLETVAAYEGTIASENALTGSSIEMNFKVIPNVIFTNPSIAVVGQTDAEANNAGIRCSCRTIPMSFVPKAEILGDTRGLIKMVINNQTQEILGIHIFSPLAHELIHEATMIVKNKMTVDEVINTLHVFPTMSEAIRLVAQSFRMDLNKVSCCI